MRRASTPPPVVSIDREGRPLSVTRHAGLSDTDLFDLLDQMDEHGEPASWELVWELQRRWSSADLRARMYRHVVENAGLSVSETFARMEADDRTLPDEQGSWEWVPGHWRRLP